ncbi:MAG: patatin-like phospholipase family protein [Xanthomonadales bacterium]|nr:patatin-like phospholipase family protein [Xanthomonadales bacterium]
MRERGRPPGTGRRTGLVLPGGGARGAYQVGVLAAVSDVLGPSSSKRSPFDIICGTSAGAVNAVVLASHAGDFAHAVGRLRGFWSGLRCASIYRTDVPTVLAAALRWLLALGSGGLLPVAPRSLLDNTPLRQLLARELRLERLPEAIDAGFLRGVAVSASAYTRASAISFYQGRHDLEPWERTRRAGEAVRLDVAHVMASAALPLIFPAERIGGEYYGDGGMRMGAPLSPAIHLGADRLLVIGTRDEHPDPAPTSAPVYPGAAAVGGYLLDTVFMDTLQADLARLQRINDTLSLMTPDQRVQSTLRPLDVFVIRPSRDLRDLTAEHAASLPGTVKLLLRTLGGWGRDWRMASYLMFEASYCQALIDLGYQDGLAQAKDLRRFFDDPRPDAVPA